MFALKNYLTRHARGKTLTKAAFFIITIFLGAKVSCMDHPSVEGTLPHVNADHDTASKTSIDAAAHASSLQQAGTPGFMTPPRSSRTRNTFKSPVACVNSPEPLVATRVSNHPMTLINRQIAAPVCPSFTPPQAQAFQSLQNPNDQELKRSFPDATLDKAVAAAASVCAVVQRAPSTPQRSPRFRPLSDLQTPPPQPRPLFSSNREKLQKLHASALLSPRGIARAEALMAESEELTPLLRELYKAQFSPADPQNPTPERPDVPKRKRKKSSKKKLNAAATEILYERLVPEAPIPINSYQIIQRDAIIDPDLMDEQGITNIQRMLAGNAPLGPDRKPINLHHITRQDPGTLIEISRGLHTRESGPLHIDSNGVKNREEFDKFRRQYWKSRARELMKNLVAVPATP